MSRQDSIFQGFGALKFPLNSDDITDGLTPLDPARKILIDLFEAAINAELGNVWQKVVGRSAAPAITGQLDGGNAHPFFDTLPVAFKLELEPNATTLLQLKPKFPMLCVHRAGTGTFEPHTLEEDRLVQPWDVHYVLGPLDVADLRKVADICVPIAKLLRMVVRQRGHKSYQSGALQFFPGAGGLMAVDLESFEGPGQARFAGDESGTLYYAMTAHLKTSELTSDDNSVFPDAEGTDFQIGVGNQLEILPGLIYASSDVPLQQG